MLGARAQASTRILEIRGGVGNVDSRSSPVSRSRLSVSPRLPNNTVSIRVSDRWAQALLQNGCERHRETMGLHGRRYRNPIGMKPRDIGGIGGAMLARPQQVSL